MVNRNKIIAIVLSALGLIGILSGITYAFFNYTKSTGTQQMSSGDILFRLNEGEDEISLTNVFPESTIEARSRNDNYITFSINGKNTSNKTIYYELVLDYGETLSSPKSRYKDEDLRFDLVELDANGNEIEYLVDALSYTSIANKRIWVDTVDANTNQDLTRYYKLRVWLDEEVVISESDVNADYTTQEYPNKYATVKLIAKGDFQEKELYSRLTKIMMTNAVMDNTSSDYVSSSTGIDFSQDASDTNGKGLYIRSGTENDTNPIVYYRGAVTDNNVLFADKCWKIVRTTDTGGVKLIYNGEYTAANKCNNTGTTTQINEGNTTTFKFNTFNSTLAADSYMYNSAYSFSGYSNGISTYYFGNGFSWDGEKYQLDDTADVDISTSSNRHYSVLNEDKDFKWQKIWYFYSRQQCIVLTNGDDITTAMAKLHSNTNNSNAKAKIDAWYNSNLSSYTDKLEDTVYCNDRTITSGGFDPDSNVPSSNIVTYAANNRGSNPSLACSKNDSFTVANEVGNKKLTYPVGMITYDELKLGGNNSTSYLSSGSEYFTMSPAYFHIVNTQFYTSTGDEAAQNAIGLRPMISLKSTTKILNGSGTVDDPYVVD